MVAMHFEFFLCIAYVSVFSFQFSVLLPWLPSLFALCVLPCFRPVLLSAAAAPKGGLGVGLRPGKVAKNAVAVHRFEGEGATASAVSRANSFSPIFFCGGAARGEGACNR